MSLVLHPLAAVADPRLDGLQLDREVVALLRSTLRAASENNTSALVGDLFDRLGVRRAAEIDAAVAGVIDGLAGALEIPARSRERVSDLADVLALAGVCRGSGSWDPVRTWRGTPRSATAPASTRPDRATSCSATPQAGT